MVASASIRRKERHVCRSGGKSPGSAVPLRRMEDSRSFDDHGVLLSRRRKRDVVHQLDTGPSRLPGRRPRARGPRSGGAAPGRIVKVAAEAVELSPLPRTDCAQVHRLRRGRAHGAPPEPRRQLRSGCAQGQRRARRVHADGTVGEGLCRMSLDLNALRKRRKRVGSSCAVIER